MRAPTQPPWEYARTDQFDQSIDIFESKTARTLFRSINSLPIEEAEANCKAVCEAINTYRPALEKIIDCLKLADGEKADERAQRMFEIAFKALKLETESERKP